MNTGVKPEETGIYQKTEVKNMNDLTTKKKILLVDDDVDLLEMYRRVLAQAGYQVRTANDSVEGLEAFEAFGPDAAFVDLAMEHFDSGFVLCHRIKQTPAGQTTPVYILTSIGHDTGYRFSTETTEEKNWIKADGYMEKPVSPRDLLDFLNEKIFRAA